VLPERGELHFIGGADPDTPVTNVDHRDHWVLDLNGGRAWTPAPPVPDDPAHPGWGINHPGYSAYQGRIYLFGGQHLLLTKLSTTSLSWCYDPATHSWRRLADLPVPRSHIAGTTFPVGDDILLLGGEIHHDRSDALNNADAYNPATDRWEANTPLPRKNLVSSVGGTANGNVYAATGSYSDTSYRGHPAP
jgi:N-acetylneuraminic acid mutarotase